MPSPVCVECEVEYRAEKNGIVAEEMADFGSYKLWRADLWKCPGCGHRLITGFGQQNFAEHWQPGYKETCRQHPSRYPFFMELQS
jgi:hypothetical protein